MSSWSPAPRVHLALTPLLRSGCCRRHQTERLIPTDTSAPTAPFTFTYTVASSRRCHNHPLPARCRRLLPRYALHRSHKPPAWVVPGPVRFPAFCLVLCTALTQVHQPPPSSRVLFTTAAASILTLRVRYLVPPPQRRPRTRALLHRHSCPLHRPLCMWL